MIQSDDNVSWMQRIRVAYTGLANREKRLVFIAIPSLILFLALMWFVEPQFKTLAKVERQIVYKEEQLSRINATQAELVAELKIDPDEKTKKRIASLQGRLTALEEKFKLELGQLISPQAMPLLLQQLFHNATSLTLLKMESIPPTQLFAELKSNQTLFEHGIRLSFEGEYFATRDFLKNAENLGWKLYWRKLDYRVDEHPIAATEVELFTLSTEEAFIGVN